MANMFYFSGSADAGPALNKNPHLLRRRTKKSKALRLPKMDFSQHACVARFDEPTFCANDGLFLLGRYQLQTQTSIGPCVREEGLNHLLDDDLHMVDADTSDLRSRLSSTPALTDVGRNAGVLCSRHPRPQDPEMWQEEDGRRVRFALDGDDISDVPHFLLDNRNASFPPGPASAWYSSPTPSAPQPQPELPVPLGPDTNMDSLWIGTFPAVLPSGPPVVAPSGSTVALQHAITEDEWLPVDHPRRSYDVVDFLNGWPLHSALWQRHVIPVHPPQALPPSVQEVCGDDVSSGTIDIQGIPWPSLGIRREDALAARKSFHPSRRHVYDDVTVGTCVGQNEERAYQFRNYVSRHRAQHTHYQLRNLLVADSRSDVMYANQGKVYRTSLAVPSSSEVVMDLVKSSNVDAGFRITCLGASKRTELGPYQSDAIVLAGGFNGEYAMQSLHNNAARAEGYLTHANDGIATHIHTFAARRSGLLQAAFCSNDRRLHLLDTRSQRFTDVFTYPFSINCSATSPDSRLRVLVGDDNEALITDAEKGNTLVRLQAHIDHGFACAWAENGIHVATGAQDGLCAVWDARNWARPLRTLPSIMTSPRSVHFTDDGGLVVAESEDVVSLYQASSFDKVQDMRFFGSVAGVALLDGGREIAVANSDKSVGGLLMFEQMPRGLRYGISDGSTCRRGRRAPRRTDPFVGMSDVMM